MKFDCLCPSAVMECVWSGRRNNGAVDSSLPRHQSMASGGLPSPHIYGGRLHKTTQCNAMLLQWYLVRTKQLIMTASFQQFLKWYRECSRICSRYWVSYFIVEFTENQLSPGWIFQYLNETGTQSKYNVTSWKCKLKLFYWRNDAVFCPT